MHEIMKEREASTRPTGGCYVDKLNNNLNLLVWLDLEVEKNQTDGKLSFLQIFAEQVQCLMCETISCYNPDFPLELRF